MGFGNRHFIMRMQLLHESDLRNKMQTISEDPFNSLDFIICVFSSCFGCEFGDNKIPYIISIESPIICKTGHQKLIIVLFLNH